MSIEHWIGTFRTRSASATGLGEAAALALRLADRRAEADLRRFKARVEAIDPDDYPPIEDEPE